MAPGDKGPRDPDCNHELVTVGVCPECCWDMSCSVSAKAKSDESAWSERAAWLEKMFKACEAMLPVVLRPHVREEAREGNWYALRFVSQWAREQRATTTWRQRNAA